MPDDDRGTPQARHWVGRSRGTRPVPGRAHLVPAVEQEVQRLEHSRRPDDGVVVHFGKQARVAHQPLELPTTPAGQLLRTDGENGTCFNKRKSVQPCWHEP